MFPVRRVDKAFIVMGALYHVSLGPQQPPLHIVDFDWKRGVPVEARFRTLAADIVAAVFRYRPQELTDAAQVANLAEEAVYKANRALFAKPFENPAAYVFTIFRRDADEYLKRLGRTESFDDRPGGCANLLSVAYTAADVERRILVREALESMDDLTRRICVRRFVYGESSEEIGRAVGVSANAVSIRLSRGLARIRSLFGEQVRRLARLRN